METLKELIQENVFIIYCYRNKYYDKGLENYTEQCANVAVDVLNAIELTLKTMRLTLSIDLDTFVNHIKNQYEPYQSLPLYTSSAIKITITLDTNANLPSKVWSIQ